MFFTSSRSFAVGFTNTPPPTSVSVTMPGTIGTVTLVRRKRPARNTPARCPITPTMPKLYALSSVPCAMRAKSKPSGSWSKLIDAENSMTPGRLTARFWIRKCVVLSAVTTYSRKRSTPPENEPAMSTDAPRSTKLLTPINTLSACTSPLELGGLAIGT